MNCTVISMQEKHLHEERQLSTLMAQVASQQPKDDGQHQSIGQLGPLLCWAVVFADIGSSIYYVPGILYGRVGNLAGFFVLLTMSVFVLLTLKYAEVSERFPEASSTPRLIGACSGSVIRRIITTAGLTATVCHTEASTAANSSRLQRRHSRRDRRAAT